METRSSPEERDKLRILPIRVGEGQVAGINFNTIVPDVRRRPESETAELILNRLSLISKSPPRSPVPSQTSRKKKPLATIILVLISLIGVGTAIYFGSHHESRFPPILGVTPVPLPTPSPIVFLPAPDAAPGEPPFEDLSSTPSGTGVSSIGYSLDGQFAVVCAGSEGGTVWRRTSKGLLELRSRLPGWAVEVKFNSTGNAFIAGSGVRKLQFPSDSTIQLLNPIPEHPVHSIAISFDETKAAWIEPSREPLVQAGPESGLPLPRPETQVDFLGEIGLFDLVENHESWRITTMTPILPKIYFLNDNECAVTSNCLHILDLTTKLMTPYQPCTHILTVLQKEAIGVMNDTTNQWMKMGIKSIAPAGSPVIFDTIEERAGCYSCAISPGNKALAAVVYFSGGREAILVWDLTTRKRVREWTCPGALAVAWSPLDGQLLVGGVRILRLYRFKEIAHD